MKPRRIGFTSRATCLLAAGFTAVLCGIGFGEVDLVRAGLLAVAVPVAAAALVHRGRVQISSRRGVEPAQPQAGQALTVQLTVTNRSAMRTAALMLEDTLPEHVPGRARFVVDPLAGREARRVSYRIPRLPRGRHRVGPLRIRLCDPFRLVDVVRSFTATHEFVVGPVVEVLPPLMPPRSDDLGRMTGSRSVGSHGADDQSTREYRIGDDLRKIHWRSSARVGSLMVRQEERPWQGQDTVLLDLRAAAHMVDTSASAGGDPRDSSSVEWAISAAASVGTHLLHAGNRMSLLTEGAQVQRVAMRSAQQLSTYLADPAPTSVTGLAALGSVLGQATAESTLVAVLGRVDPAALKVLTRAHAGGRSGPAFAMLLDVASWSAGSGFGGAAVDAGASTTGRSGSFAPGHPDGGSGTPQTGGAEPAGAARAEVRAAANVLRAGGWRVVVVSRGDRIADAWRTMLAGYGPAPRLQDTLR